MKRVSYIFPISHHFRYPFHVRLRDALAKDGIDYNVIYSAPYGTNVRKMDTVDVPWGHKVPLLRLGGALLQWAPADLLRSDLVIVQQENRQLLNYFAQALGMLGARKIAFFGHGRNFQSRNPHSLAERWKRFWATKVDWWFAYTEETKRYLISIGFPEERIVVFNNAIDTGELARQAAAVTIGQLTQRRKLLGLEGNNVCVYVGGLYPDKRLDFLLEALDQIRVRVPDFEFVAVGGGPDLPILSSAAENRPWLKVTGPQFGIDKVELMALGKLFLIPGLVGLAILDAGVMGLPVVTTDYPYHSPEIAYLKDGHNGIIARPWTDATAYSMAVVNLLTGDPTRLEVMRDAARIEAMSYTIEAMAEQFAQGVIKALEV